MPPPAPTLRVPGRAVDPKLPRDFAPRVRGAGVQADVFLPARFVEAVATLDLARPTRAADGSVEKVTVAAAGQVIALELQGGVTIYTSFENLRATLEQVAPDAIGADGSLDLEKLQVRAEATRGVIGERVGSLVTRVFTLVVGQTADPIVEAAKQKLAEFLGGKAEDAAELGVSRLGTKALMWAIESKLLAEPGLYRWGARLDASAKPVAADDLAAAAQAGPLLVFVHGTGSNTEGGFGDLRGRDWEQLARQYPNRIVAFEHRTLSESPIENAIELARALPAGATLHLVTHSRGGLVGDLLCLAELTGKDAALVKEYALDKFALGKAESAERTRLIQQLTEVYEEQREQLRELGELLAKKKLRVERYVRVAAPSRGTRLASGNFDVFLSALLSLIGLVPALAGQPLYSAFKRVVLEIAKNRTKPGLVPGIEAMLPESPMARLLARATPQDGTQLAVIAGDIEGGSLLKRLGVFFTDHVFFDAVQNDLVVDTDSMYAGVARPRRARALFEQGPSVNHFRYFENESSRAALRAWLTAEDPTQLGAFAPLRGVSGEPLGPVEAAAEAARRVARGAEAAQLPVVVVLPGTMGSHLWRNRKDRIWLDPLDVMKGGLGEIRWGEAGIEAEKLFSLFYGDLCEHLARTHRVERFPYDWRQPIGELADRLDAFLRGLLDDPALAALPIRLLAHSMGGLVVRGLVAKHRATWDRLMARAGARFVMLGTPNQGSHSMVEALLGKSKTLRMLARADVRHGLQGVLDIVGGFPGALQLLPKPGFVDTGETAARSYFDAAFWARIKPQLRDFWFGDGVAALPAKADLDAGGWLWTSDGVGAPSLPTEHAGRVSYVYGCAPNTPCGIEQEGGRWKLRGTPLGDGTVTWDSGKIDGIGTFFWMPAEHGALADTEEYFDSLVELLAHGTPGRLTTRPPITREAAAAPTVLYDAGAPAYPTEVELAGGLLGVPRNAKSSARVERTLEVGVTAMDLRGVTTPILVGHYEQDAISGAEAIVDRKIVDGQLSIRYDLGLYAGALGTATIVLIAPNEEERRRGSQRGAIVTGLGVYDGSLSAAGLTEAVRVAVLRYLTQLLDGNEHVGTASGRLALSSLLLGYNSSVSLSIADSVAALVRGVAEANLKFAEVTRSSLHIGSLEIVELFLDTAISTAREVVRLASALESDRRLGCRVVAATQLAQGETFQIRLEDNRGNAYWPRLHVTGSADRRSFLFVGPRARAEAVLHQNQAGLTEKLVAQQLLAKRYSAEFSRALFQLSIPGDLKDVVRRADRLVFVVDEYTANVPWESMQADATPVAVRSALIRQLASTGFRSRVRQSVENRAYVVGNPSTRNFATHFPGIPLPPNQTDLDSLEAAEREAGEVAQLLEQQGMQVTRSIDRDCEALDVITRLHQQPYRIIHIAAHGLFEALHADKSLRTGVVLSDGFLLTAVEIGALESVPDLVFLNCCHLAKTSPDTAYNKLAYSVASELMKMGVRAVIVAGWAVEDEASQYFATTFYQRLLRDGMDFGDAVFEARKSTYDRYPEFLTWGAFQAYGDPGWRFDPKRDPYGARAARDPEFVAPEELLQRLAACRSSLANRDREPSQDEAAEQAREVQALLAKAPPAWLERPDVCTALGNVHAELGTEYFEPARAYYEKAIAKGDSRGRVPIRAIEQLANLESRHGQRQGDANLIDRAIGRLRDLASIVLEKDPEEVGDEVLEKLDAERLALLGSAYKSRAAVHARDVVSGAGVERLKEMEKAIVSSARYYGAGAGDPTSPTLNPYRKLNSISLVASKVGPEATAAYAEIARRCREKALADFARDRGFWPAIGVADGTLVERLFDGGFTTARGSALVDELERGYRQVRTGIPVKPKEWDSVIRQIRLLALFHRARATEDAGLLRVADQLQELANKLDPGGADAVGGAKTSAPKPPATEKPRKSGRRGNGRKR